MNLEFTSVLQPDRRAVIRRGQRLQYATIAWNSAECVVAVLAGLWAGSIALVGFGFDSAIEVTSSLAALWRLRHEHDEVYREATERQTMRIIGVCFLLLAVYISYEAATTLIEQKTPHHSSIVGIVLAALSLIVMPLLVHFKRQIASRLESGALEAGTRQTEICFYLSGILLVGLGLNAWVGWWWADPIAGLAMVPLIGWKG